MCVPLINAVMDKRAKQGLLCVSRCSRVGERAWGWGEAEGEGKRTVHRYTVCRTRSVQTKLLDYTVP